MNSFQDYYDDQEEMHKYKRPKEIHNRGDFDVKNGKMLFQRVGPINRQHQTNSRAPTSNGIWAFPWPIFDYFFVSGKFSHPQQMAPKNKRFRKLNSNERNQLESILQQKKEELIKLKSSVPNFKTVNKDNPKVANQIYDLLYDIEDIQKHLKDSNPNIGYIYDKYFGKEYEVDAYDKVELTPEQRTQLERQKKNIERAIKAIELKVNPELGYRDPYYEKLENLQYKLSDINEMLTGEVVGKDSIHQQLHSKKFNKLKTFRYGGPIYAHFSPKGMEDKMIGEWYRYETIKDYLEQLRKQIISLDRIKSTNKEDDPGNLVKWQVRNTGIGNFGSGNLSSDHLEVFIPL